jgi:hypothetical protein
METLIADLFGYTGGGVAGLGWLFIVVRPDPRRMYGCFALGNGLCLVSDVMDANQFTATLSGAICAYCAWGWWNSGGGNGTKRRLRALRRRFQGVRRTAPALGGA